MHTNSFKIASARELIDLTAQSARAIADLGKSQEVALVVNDRLDVVLAARKQGVKVDGIHVGQSDIPTDVCREYLGEDSIVGLSAKTEELLDYIRLRTLLNRLFRSRPLHQTMTKPDCGLSKDGDYYQEH